MYQGLNSLTPDQRRELLRRLLILLQQQQVSNQPKRDGPTTFDKAVEYAKKAKGYYDTAKSVYDLGTSAYQGLTAPQYSPATQANWNRAAGEAAQAAWNANANAATNASASGANSGATGASDFSWGEAVPYVNAAIAAYNGYKAYKNKNLNTRQRNYQMIGAAGQAYGGGAGNIVSGLANAASALSADNATEEEKTQAAAHAIGIAAANYYTAGMAGLADGFARKQWGGTMRKLDKFRFNTPGTPEWALMKVAGIWDTDKWKTEGNRLKGLMERGINIPPELQAAMQLKRGRKKKDLINPYVPKDFIGNTPQYGWVNNKFADSRNESDLKPEDIWGYSAFFDKYGNDWLGKFNEQQRRAIAQKALDRGAVNEHHGTIDINWSPELDAEAQGITAQNNMIPRWKRNNRTPAASPPVTTPTSNPQPTAEDKKTIARKALRRI